MKSIEMPCKAGEPPGVRRSGGGRKISDLSPDLVRSLSKGERATTTWTEWMAVNTGQLTFTVAGELPQGRLRQVLVDVSNDLAGKGILERLNIVGRAVASAADDVDDPAFQHLVSHRSDAVRQWGAYAVNHRLRTEPLENLLKATLTFAADPHMSVRECAWMAFRPHLLARLDDGLYQLIEVAQSPDPRCRRFAVEVSRPRSVWGQHCTTLKTNPELGRPVLEAVKGELSRYVQLSVGNWLNDASKSRPDWVRALCERWSRDGNAETNWMARRGLRTLTARALGDAPSNLQPTFHQFVPLSPGGG